MFHILFNKNFLHHIRKFFCNFTVRLIFCFIVCSTLPFTILGIVNYHNTYSLAKEKITQSVFLSDKQLLQQFNSRFAQMQSVADSSNNYAYTLANVAANKNSDLLDYFSISRSSIDSLNSNFNLLHTCIFLPSDSFFSNEGLMFYKLNDLKDFDLQKSDLTNLGINYKWIYKNKLSFPITLSPTTRDEQAILCCSSLTRNNKLIYALFTSIKSSELSQQLYRSFSDTPISSYLCTPKGQIVAHNNTAFIGSYIPSENFNSYIEHINNGTEIFIYNSNNCIINTLDNGYYLISEIPLDYISSSINSVITLSITSLIIIIFFIFLIAIILSDTLSKKLRQLTKVVQSTNISNHNVTIKELNKLFHIDSDYRDEVDNLALNYQKMLRTIDNNLSEILELSLMEEKLKYQLLQSQINPHFLYNILDSIRTCLSIEKLNTAKQLITNLAKFYRLTLRKTNDLLPIRDELEIATLYLELEQLCRNDNFEWAIHLDDDIENFMICKFTLQPFLENCIQHAIKRSSHKVHISINVTFGDDTIIIKILDDGAGINPTELKNLQHVLKEKTVDYTKNFGIGNVNSRIASPLYGFGTVSIESTLNIGTTVTIEFQQVLDDNIIK